MNGETATAVGARWQWAGSLTIGPAHVVQKKPCQDAASVWQYSSVEGPVLVAVVADGAGSAAHAEVGSCAAALGFQRLVSAYLLQGGLPSAIDAKVMAEWFVNLNVVLRTKAAAMGVEVRALASTITCCVVSEQQTHIGQIGDSVCVLGAADHWYVPIWPMNGEFANVTYFLNEFPDTLWKFETVPGPAEWLFLFSDGISDVVLDDRAKRPFAAFFSAMSAATTFSVAGKRDRGVSNRVRGFLSSERMASLSSDDKTLIIIRRVLAEQ